MGRISEAARAARRDQVLAAALACFARGGYHATTMSDVATEAGVSKGTPYLYFPSKEALFLALYEQWDCGLADRVQAAVDDPDVRAANSPRRVLRAVILAVGAHVEDHTQACRVLMEAGLMAADQPELASVVRHAQAGTDQSLTELVQAGVAAGEWPTGTDPALQAQLIAATLYGLMARWHLEPGSVSWEKVADALAGIEQAMALSATSRREREHPARLDDGKSTARGTSTRTSPTHRPPTP
jgi:AcrR family transcriptional regulator